MHSESVIFSAIYAFFTRLKTSYEKSAYHMAFCRLFDIIGAFFGKILNKLLFFGKYSHGNNVFAGIANSGIQFFHRIFGGMAKSLMQKSEESFLVRTANLVFNSWHLISVRSYSEVLLAFTLVRLAIVRAVGRVNDKYTLVFLIASAIGICVPASFSGLYQGSLLRRQMGLYDLKNPSPVHLPPVRCLDWQFYCHIGTFLCFVLSVLSLYLLDPIYQHCLLWQYALQYRKTHFLCLLLYLARCGLYFTLRATVQNLTLTGLMCALSS